MFRYCLAVPAVLIAPATAASAMELDTLLPAGVPGFGTGPDITVLTRLQRDFEAQPIAIAGLTITPALDASAGYDSAPNAAPGGSPVVSLSPSVTLADKTIGFGAYAGLTQTNYPDHPAQTGGDASLAVGEAAVLPQNTIIAGAAWLRSQQTGFQLEPGMGSRPASITGTVLRARDDFTTGMIILSPDLSYSHAVSSAGGETARETGAGLELQIIPDGVLHLIAYGHATDQSFSLASQNAADYTGLIGLADNAEGLWDFRLAGGFTARAPVRGHATLIPITEAAADWMPDELTSLSFSAAHEIDDPERIDTSSYTITEGRLAIAHEYLRNVLLTGTATLTHASFFQVPLIETITQATAGIAWRLNPRIKLSAEYDFNDRQANHLRAANEHVATISLAWSL